MVRIDCDIFIAYVKKYDKRNGLRRIYKDYKIKDEKDRKRCREAWDLIEGELKCQKDLINAEPEVVESEQKNSEDKNTDTSATSEESDTQDTQN